MNLDSYIYSMNSSFDPFLEIAVSAAQMAGKRALEMQGSLGEPQFKGPKDLVTIADFECDRLIRAQIETAFPDHDLLTEEEGALVKGSEYCWYVDPIDGTINYMHGLPLWGVSIGLAHRGEVICGAIYLPALNELYTACRGGGAFLNNQIVHISPCLTLASAIISHGDFNVEADGPERKRMNGENFWARMRTLDAVQRIKCLGSAAVEGAFVSAGRLDAYCMLYLYPWDVAVTSLLVREAGGMVTDLSGVPWSLEKKSALFSNGLMHKELLELLDFDHRRIPAG